jgi:uncharacterized protein
MKFNPDKTDTQTVTAYGPGWLAVNGTKRTVSCLIGSDGQKHDWPVASFEQANASHFAQLAVLASEMKAELVIFGSGNRLRFVPPAWLQGLMQQHIGLETMDTSAACRTYNILAGEGRRVLAAIILEPAEPAQ